VINRDLSRVTDSSFDVIVIGGGIYGAAMLQEAARHGLSACLCEASDFGSGTSSNSLRIVHGGLRYLQALNLPRFYQSVAARRGMAQRFPGLVRPLECLMPLYGAGLKRPAIMRMALLMNDVLSASRNSGVSPPLHLPAGEVLSAGATQRAFSIVRRQGLKGAARWRDYFMISSERILMELLRDACAHGAFALNYVKVENLVLAGNRITGVVARDAISGAELTLRAGRVINCTGARVGQMAQDRGGDARAIFRPSVAFNVLLDKTLPSASALAIAAPERGAPLLFLVPQRDTVLGGTWHVARPPGTCEAEPTLEELEQYLAHVRGAIPGFDVRLTNVRRVFAGILPVRTDHSIALLKTETLYDHGKMGGVQGLYSVAGVKFTTTGDTAQRLMHFTGLARKRPGAEAHTTPLPLSRATPVLTDARQLSSDKAAARDALLTTLREEAVLTLDDLILRRTNWATTEPDLESVRQRVMELVGEQLAMLGNPAAPFRKGNYSCA
jgi:glycerol-3-phosphate dehydrogenase